MDLQVVAAHELAVREGQALATEAKVWTGCSDLQARLGVACEAGPGSAASKEPLTTASDTCLSGQPCLSVQVRGRQPGPETQSSSCSEQDRERGRRRRGARLWAGDRALLVLRSEASQPRHQVSRSAPARPCMRCGAAEALVRASAARAVGAAHGDVTRPWERCVHAARHAMLACMDAEMHVVYCACDSVGVTPRWVTGAARRPSQLAPAPRRAPMREASRGPALGNPTCMHARRANRGPASSCKRLSATSRRDAM